MTRAYVTRTRYRRWLQAHDPATVVGVRELCHACVFQRFLAATHPAGCTWVQRTAWQDGALRVRPMPGWAQWTIGDLDTAAGDLITAGEALALLEEAML